MPRPKNDADKLSQNRRERRELIDSIDDTEMDEISEVTNPAIHVHMNHPPSPPAQPVPRSVAPRPPMPSADVALGTLDRLPPNHRVWVILALVAALLAAVLAGRIVLGSNGVVSTPPVAPPAAK